jgi:hypothetical protein
MSCSTATSKRQCRAESTSWPLCLPPTSTSHSSSQFLRSVHATQPMTLSNRQPACRYSDYYLRQHRQHAVLRATTAHLHLRLHRQPAVDMPNILPCCHLLATSQWPVPLPVVLDLRKARGAHQRLRLRLEPGCHEQCNAMRHVVNCHYVP